jgi:hypothetical protein
MFRALDKSEDGYLNREEFCRFFEVIDLKWKPLLIVPQKPWRFFKKFGVLVIRFLKSPYAEYIFSKSIT